MVLIFKLGSNYKLLSQIPDYEATVEVVKQVLIPNTFFNLIPIFYNFLKY